MSSTPAPVASKSVTTTPSGGPSGETTPVPASSTGPVGLPQYGIVRWRDAASPPRKIRKDRLTKNLAIREDIGWLWQDAYGTIMVLHNRILKGGNTNKYEDKEYTLIPAAWVVEVIPLATVPVAQTTEAARCDRA